MGFGDSDTTAILADLEALGGTVGVTLGSATVQGLLEHQAVEVLSAEGPGAIANDQAVHVQTGALPGLASGSALTVGGTAYVVREALPYGDGAMTRIVLRRP